MKNHIHHDIYLDEQQYIKLPVASEGDWSIKFEPEQILLDDQQIYYPSQARDAQLSSLTNISSAFGTLLAGEVWDEFSIAVGGIIAPPTAIAGGEVTNGLVGPPAAEIPPRVAVLTSRRFSCGLEGYLPVVAIRSNMSNPDDEGAVMIYRAKESVDLGPGWNLLQFQTDMIGETFLVYGAGNDTIPSFEYDKNHIFEIHPDDLPYGYLIGGYILSKVGDTTVVRQKYRNIITTDDGLPDTAVDGDKLELHFTIVGKSGCQATIPITIQVSTDAVRRGPNINPYEQENVLLDYSK